MRWFRVRRSAGDPPARRGRGSGVLLLWFALWLVFMPGAAQARDLLKIGVLDYAGAEHSRDHWEPTRAALAAALPDHRFEIVALDLSQLETALRENQIDFVITNPGNYAEIEQRYHVSRIATAEDDAPVASTLVTTSDIATLKDLAGKRLAIVSPEAFGGFQTVWLEMAAADAGLPRRVKLEVTGYPMQKAAEAVLDGSADAAVLRGCMLEQLRRDAPARYGKLHAFAENEQASAEAGCALSTPIYPGWPFAKARGTSPVLAKRVAIALMQMQEGNFWTVPLDYQPVHALMRTLQIGPYARTGPVSLRAFVSDYRDWIIAFGIALMFWGIYSVRIETLVRRRTRSLDEANAALTREIAERKRAEEADRRHRRELEHVARLSILGEMATSIAHELNQPLSAISNYAQGCLLRMRVGRFTEADMQRATQEMADQAERAATVIKRIRAFVGKRERRLDRVALPALIEDCSAIYSGSARRAGVEVVTDIAPVLPEIIADGVQLQQVILNLVQNAIDAMGEEPPENRWLKLRVVPHADLMRGKGVRISVRDRGHGMSDAAMDHFAEAFYTTKSEGIGLGLALSRSIVEAHGGWMRAERPEDGVGLRVIVWLPEGESA